MKKICRIWILLTLGMLIPCKGIHAQEEQSVSVDAVGYGMTAKEANENALRVAVRQAIGMYVTEETIVKNEDIIKDQILTASLGIVKSYEVLKPAMKNSETGLYQITIKAVVRKDQVESKLRAAKIIATKVEGKDLWAESVSKISNFEEGKKALEALFKEFDLPRSLLIARIVDDNGNKGEGAVPTTQANEKNAKKMDIAFNVEIYCNLEPYYKQVAPKILRLLDVIAKEKSQQVVVRKLNEDENKTTAITEYPWRREEDNFHNQLSDIKKEAGYENDEIYGVAINIGRDRSGCNQRFAIYFMDKKYAAVWEKLLRPFPKLDVVLENTSGSTIAQESVAIDHSLIGEINNKTRGLIPLKKAIKDVIYNDAGSSMSSSFPKRDEGWITVLPEFGCNKFCDTILFRYETTLAAEDLKELGAIKVHF